MRRLVTFVLSLSLFSALSLPAAYAAAPSDGTLPMTQLPAWVQVASVTAPLFTSDTSSTSTGSRLQRHAYLRVLGGGTERLLIETADDGTRRGWIDPDDVAPSAPAEGWRVSGSNLSLWSTPGADASVSRTLEPFTPLLQVDGPVQGRIEVRVYRADFLQIVASGWVGLEETGPALAPAARAVSPSYAVQRTASVINHEQTFLDIAAEAAMLSSQRTGVPASVTVAQAILESDWGRSVLSRNAGNYFGMKAIGGLGNDGVVWLPTIEYDASGERYETLSPFRAYKSLTDSMVDHDLLLRHASRYAPAMQVANDPRQFAQMLVQGGYATDPAYADKLIALMDRYDLYRLDA